MTGLKYRLILEEPVLANSLAGDANSARSLPYIPGGLIRGGLVSAYLGRKKVDAGDPEFQGLFLSGKVRFLHAYPEGGGKRTLPPPLSWRTYKHPAQQKVIFNFSEEIVSEAEIKGVPFEFYWLDKNIVKSIESEWQIQVHTQRDAVFGRARGEGQGAIYRYEALPAGMCLQGVILTESGSEKAKIKALLENRDIFFGKARSAEYGHAKFADVEDLPDGWCEWDEASPKPSSPVKRITITLLSDAIMRDSMGQYTLDILPVVQALVGDKIKLIQVAAFRKSTIIGGFNRKWGLPLPQAHAIAAGSVFVINVDPGLPPGALNGLMHTGIGERLVEGFGRFSIVLSQPSQLDWEEYSLTKDPQAGAIPLTADDRAVADLMLSRLLKRRLEEKVVSVSLAASRKYVPKSIPNSQLSRWRVIVRNTIGRSSEDDKRDNRLLTFYQKENKRNSAAWQKMNKARVVISGKTYRLTDWLERVFSNPKVVWVDLDFDKKPAEHFSTHQFQPDDQLEYEYSLRMVDAVLASLIKKNSGETGGTNG